MAEDVASRVAGDEALLPELRERVERAAAQFDSIHERWSTAKEAEPPLLRLVGDGAGDGAVTEAALPAHDASLLERDAVSVTPILGIETDESEDGGRPRFKTLMGVPRSSPELDELAGLDGSSGRHDTVPIERSALQPPTALASSGSSRPQVDDAPSLAGTSLPSQRETAPPSQPQRVAPWPPLAGSPPDLSAEVAALRTSARRRLWSIGMGAIAAAAVFALAAPRQRTHALRWLEGEYRARLARSADPISDTARALRPGASVVAAPRPGFDRVTAQLEPPAAALARVQGADDHSPASLAVGRAAPPTGSSEDSREAAAGAQSSSRDAAQGEPVRDSVSSEPVAIAGLAAARATSSTASTKSNQAVRDTHSSGTTSKARAQVAAPRKPSQHADDRQLSRATKVATNTTKARATRQNTPRKDSGGGIIRETPF